MSTRIKRKPAKYAEEEESPGPPKKTPKKPPTSSTPVAAASPKLTTPKLTTPKPTSTKATPSAPRSTARPSQKKSPEGQKERKADKDSKKPLRSCEKSRCPAKIPQCFANASDRCAGAGSTARWYHLSAGEHYCNECFDYFYRSHHQGYQLVSNWKRVWGSNGKTEPSLKSYMSDKVLPFWLQCTQPGCGKWREFPSKNIVTLEIIQSYVCGYEAGAKQGTPSDHCTVLQDHRVEQTFDLEWLSLLVMPPLLKTSPAAPFLTSYFPDGVGLSASCPIASRKGGSLTSEGEEPFAAGVSPYFQPFYQPDEQGKALCICPDVMEHEEVEEFPEFEREQQMYLALRNLVLALWAQRCKEFLTAHICTQRLVVRGLVRIKCSEILEPIVAFLTRKGLINTGLLRDPPKELQVCRDVGMGKIIVIGAGVAGLAAARHLTNMGCDVTMLEARDRIGGRVWDDQSLGSCVGKGAQIVNGCINNPIALMCEQGGFKLRKMHERCDLLGEGGVVTDLHVDKRVEFHFNAMLDAIAEWRKDKFSSSDSPLGKKIMEMHQTFMDETNLTFSAEEDTPSAGVSPYFQPFYQPDEQGKALCICPDVMEHEEVEEFPEFEREQQMYLALRNLVLALWAQRCKGKIIVIGAGVAGLAAARHLTNMGCDVTMLEARDRIGGRVWDDQSLGSCVGKGAQIVNGCINNPIALMCEQGDFKLRKMHERCDLLGEGGVVTDLHVDKRVEFHFNAMLDAIAEWRKDKFSSSDSPLGKKIMEMHQTFMDETNLTFSAEEDRLLQFHISNLEYACGSNLAKVSSLHWDQNEAFAQFAGDHCLLKEGYHTVFTELAKGLDVRLQHQVTAVNHSADDITITLKDGQTLTAQKVLLTIPLALLQSEVISFTPPLPEDKLEAINSLGSGIIEKIGLQFPSRFWEKKVEETDYFGYIPTDPADRGFFSIFYDMSNGNKESNVLMSIISGDAVQKLKEMTEKEVMEKCLSCLKKLFPKQTVPNPSKYFVTQWHKDEFAGMSYSFIASGASGETYDVLAECIDEKIFFAGEATNRSFPQTVTGAYLSGIREANKIIAL
eukprot:XP_011667313.1 PREDICTED: lysine-specific histone demethylase 1B [Strongylocentrotus purpuratus]